MRRTPGPGGGQPRTSWLGIKVITFDLDNTLWDVEPALVKAEQAQFRWLQEHYPRLTQRFSKREIRVHRMKFWKANPELAHQISELRIQSTRELLLISGYSETEAGAAAEQAFATFLSVRHQVEPFQEVVEVLEQLAGNYTLGALTNGNADVFKLEIGDCFDFAYTAEQLNASKPLPDMFHAALERTGVREQELLHVGDNPQHDVGGAHAAGVYSVWLNPGGGAWTAGEPAHAEIRNLRQLPGAIIKIEELAGRG